MQQRPHLYLWTRVGSTAEQRLRQICMASLASIKHLLFLCKSVKTRCKLTGMLSSLQSGIKHATMSIHLCSTAQMKDYDMVRLS